MIPWICDRCVEEAEQVSVNDLRRAGAAPEPASDPDAICRCDNRPPEAVRLRLVVEKLMRLTILHSG